VPSRILNGRKRGFSIPAAAWLRGQLEPFAREVLAAGELERQGFFRPAPVAALLDDHVSRRRDNSRQLWGLISFALWYDRIARAPAPASPAAGVAGS
jgi:asparagine synthase (glutamine-hydrolysing)